MYQHTTLFSDLLTERNRLDPAVWMTLPQIAKRIIYPDTGEALRPGDVGVLLKY